MPGDYRLESGSPCINAGVNLDWMDDAKDLAGRERIDPLSRKVDVGAYEYQYAGTTILIR